MGLDRGTKAPGQTPGASAVEVTDLAVSFGHGTSAVDALRGLSFRAPAGEVTALLGPNGAGKTTTVDILGGFLHPDSGAASVLGIDPGREPGRVRNLVGIMPQQPGVHTGLRPLEALELYAAFYESPLDPREMLSRVGLDTKVGTSFRRLSGGEQQRLSLALALIGAPRLAILDEPTAGVDPEGRLMIRELIADLRRSGVAVLMTTHDLDEAERLADYVVIIDGGRSIASGTPAELMSAGGRGTISFRAPTGIDVLGLGSDIGAAVIEVRPGEYRVDSDVSPKLIAVLTAWLAERDLVLGDLSAGHRRLEDVFLKLTGEQDEQADSEARPS